MSGPHRMWYSTTAVTCLEKATRAGCQGVHVFISEVISLVNHFNAKPYSLCPVMQCMCCDDTKWYVPSKLTNCRISSLISAEHLYLIKTHIIVRILIFFLFFWRQTTVRFIVPLYVCTSDASSSVILHFLCIYIFCNSLYSVLCDTIKMM